MEPSTLSNKFTMPIGTMLLNCANGEHYIYLGIESVMENHGWYDEAQRERLYVNFYCVEEQTNFPFPFYDVIDNIQREFFKVVHDPNKS